MENENITFLNTTIEKLKKTNSSLERSLIATQNQTIEVKTKKNISNNNTYLIPI